jgi:hypothetical protein
MNLKQVGLFGLTVVALLGASPKVIAQLPADFPGITVSNYVPGAVAEGYVFLAVASVTPGIGTYQMILKNDGTPVWYQKLPNEEIYDFKVQPNGYLSYAPFIEEHSYTGGGDVYHELRNDAYDLKETVTGGNGYVAEGHDFQVLANGNILQFGYYLSEVDMSQIIAGGHPAALISGGVVQELDAQRNVVFQWRTWDYYKFADKVTSQSAVISAFHLNDINQDPDGNLILGTPTEIRKLNRQTGQVLWTLGGPDNEFTALGAGASTNHFGGHGTYRIANGNFLMYANGNRQGTVSSKVYEYTLDEVAKNATLVWSYTPDKIFPAWHRGNAQRLPNGNTFIGWGGASATKRIPACTEVTPAGQKVFELYFNTNSPPVESYRAFRFSWPPTNKLEDTEFELATGNTYVFTNTGVSLEIQAGGGGYNEFTVTRQPYAPVNPIFQETAPRILPVRVKMIATAIPSLTATVSFNTLSFGFSQPTNLTIYYRPQAGQGIFIAQPTDNSATNELRTTLTMNSTAGEMGEFIFGYPDLPDVAFAPLLNKPENYRGIQTHEVIAPPLALTGAVYSVNQQLPISLAWSPKGMARWYELEIATNQAFTNQIIAVPYQTAAYYLWSNALPNTAYFYRVKTWNDAGASGWSTGAFQTVAPAIQVTAPNGGEAWRRGVKNFLRWNDNLAESVVLDLYKGGTFFKSLATNSSAGAYQWEVGLDLAPASDYSIKIRSTTNSALFDMSDTTFSIIDVPVIDASSVTRLPDGRVQFGLTAPGAAQATLLGSTNLSVWQELQTVTLTNSSAVVTDDTATNLPSRYYRLRVP